MSRKSSKTTKVSKASKAAAKKGPAKRPAPAAPAAVTASTRTIREGTKQAGVIAMLRSATGATIEQMAKATGWQNHTVRGALAGALKKRLGLTIVSKVDEERRRVYRIAG